MRAPSCRTKIFPARTVSPPKTFTPRRCPWLSRPLRELPPAFLCAIRLLSQLSFDCRDLQSRLILSVTALAAVAFAPLLFKDQNLFCPDLTNDFAGHLGVGDQGRADLYVIIAADKQHIR